MTSDRHSTRPPPGLPPAPAGGPARGGPPSVRGTPVARPPLHLAETVGHRRRRHRVRLPFRIVPLVVLLLAGGWLAWAATTEGGITARIDDAVESLRGTVEGATADPGAKRAAIYFNDRYAAEGAYPEMSEAQMSRDDEIDWGVGVEVTWCGPRAVLLSSLSGSGTVTRLLLEGRDLGDVRGRATCPIDYADPQPWNLGSGD